MPPIVHQAALTPIACLKKPAAAPGVKISELAALCVAVMRPTHKTWKKFVDALRRLRAEGTITDDETAAIVRPWPRRQEFVAAPQFYEFPEEHWVRIRSTNGLERLHGEIKRRIRSMGAFPDRQSASSPPSPSTALARTCPESRVSTRSKTTGRGHSRKRSS